MNQQNNCQTDICQTGDRLRRHPRRAVLTMADFGKILVFFGVILLVLGALFLLLGRTSLPLGRLPGDILYRGKNTTFYFPFTTSILLSAVLSLILYVIGKLRH